MHSSPSRNTGLFTKKEVGNVLKTKDPSVLLLRLTLTCCVNTAEQFNPPMPTFTDLQSCLITHNNNLLIHFL